MSVTATYAVTYDSRAHGRKWAAQVDHLDASTIKAVGGALKVGVAAGIYRNIRVLDGNGADVTSDFECFRGVTR